MNIDYPSEWDELPKHQRKKKIKELKRQQANKSEMFAKWRNGGIVLGVTALLGFGIYYWSNNRQVLPPTTMQGHIEQNPPTHIMDEPMPIAIQKHMLEHSDSDGPPGVIINYNCEDFNCEPDLLEKLKEIATQYPEFVYLAPFSKMSEKIAITRLGKIETYDRLDEQALIQFIEGK